MAPFPKTRAPVNAHDREMAQLISEQTRLQREIAIREQQLEEQEIQEVKDEQLDQHTSWGVEDAQWSEDVEIVEPPDAVWPPPVPKLPEPMLPPAQLTAEKPMTIEEWKQVRANTPITIMPPPSRPLPPGPSKGARQQAMQPKVPPPLRLLQEAQQAAQQQASAQAAAQKPMPPKAPPPLRLLQAAQQEAQQQAQQQAPTVSKSTSSRSFDEVPPWKKSRY